jgi:hypothetical protein
LPPAAGASLADFEPHPAASETKMARATNEMRGLFKADLGRIGM